MALNDAKCLSCSGSGYRDNGDGELTACFGVCALCAMYLPADGPCDCRETQEIPVIEDFDQEAMRRVTAGRRAEWRS